MVGKPALGRGDLDLVEIEQAVQCILAHARLNQALLCQLATGRRLVSARRTVDGCLCPLHAAGRSGNGHPLDSPAMQHRCRT